MTDKQIIVDNIDVSGCLHYAGNVNYLTDKNWTCRAGIQGTKCEDWSDCYFKSWQRKEQELQEAMDNYVKLDNQRVKEYNELVDKYNNKEQEVDVLKAENERLKQAFVESDNDCFRLEKENRLLKVYRSISPFKVKMLVRTLDEIKEIVEKPITTIKHAERECYGDAEWSELRGKCVLARQILNKINEGDDESYLNNHWLFTKEKGED